MSETAIKNNPDLEGLKAFFMRPLGVSLLALAGLLILNLSCLDNPPYWDDIMGLHNQALWLAKNNFDVIKLWGPGQNYLQGGSNIYRLGIMPYFYGILYYLLPYKLVHIFGHVFNIVCISAAAGFSFSIMRKFKVDPPIAMIWCIAVLFEPVMAGRSAALGQECPLLLATVLSLYFVCREKYWLGMLFVVLAFLCKMTAGVLAAACLLWCILVIIMEGRDWKQKFKNLLPFMISNLLLVLLFLYMNFWAPFADLGAGIQWRHFFDNIKYYFLVLMPVQALALIIIAVLAVWRIAVLIRQRNISNINDKDKFSLLLIILLGGFWTSYVLFHTSLPRYSAFVMFPMYMFIALNSSDKKKLSGIFAIILLICGITNLSGNFYPGMRFYHLRSGESLERSREYINDIWSNQALCKLLETKYYDRPIVTKWPYSQMLTIPEMGYVSKPLPNVYCACPLIKYGKVKFYGIDTKMPSDSMYIFVHNSHEFWRAFGPSLKPEKSQVKNVIFADQYRNGWIYVYEKKTLEKSSKNAGRKK